MMSDLVEVVVRERTMLTPSVCRIVLAQSGGGEFSPAEPGAHVTIHTPAGHARSYSVTDSPGGALAIAVHRQENGRGGSISAVDDIHIGDRILIDPPTNTFPLVSGTSFLLIAGGIGITAIRPMWNALRAEGCDVRLLYLARHRDGTPFLDEFEATGDAQIHYSDLDGRADLWHWLSTPDDVTHIYACASAPLLEEVRLLTMHWRPSQIHFEDFAGVDATGANAAPFEAVWSPTGTRVRVAADETMLAGLRRAGVVVDSSCESGTCGTCVLRLLRGEVDHRDLVLTDDLRASRLIPCVSRAVDDVVVAPIGDDQ